jgi:hypothetical protein
MAGQRESSKASSGASDATGQWGIIGPTSDETRCSHEMFRIDRMHHGTFLVLTTVCTHCGRILGEEKVLALEHTRCPVDPRLDRCLMSCPVEDGSLFVFEKPCQPVKRLMVSAGLVPRIHPAQLQK